MGPKLYWIDTEFPGRLAITARPRGGDWLEDEAKGWRAAGIGVVVSLLTAEENEDFDISKETDACAQSDVRFLSFPIPDRSVPSSEDEFKKFAAEILGFLRKGQNVAIHCRQSIGRSGLLAVAVIAQGGVDPKVAMQSVSFARGLTVPETPEQTEWLLRLCSSVNIVKDSDK